MSILIKGLKMPTSCLKGGCPLDGFACQLWEDKYWASYEDPEKWRHRDCPLIELPDHGDLIDRDALLKKKMKMDAFVALEWVSDVDICLERTVIPAERSEDGGE